MIDNYIEDGKVIEENGVLRTVINMSFDSPSRVTELISGQSTNGWLFFDELNEEEFDMIYNELDIYDRDEVDDAIREFADQAIGDEHWDSDN